MLVIVKMVEEGAGVTGMDHCHNNHTVTYITDMLKVTLSTPTPVVTPGVEVTVNVAVVYAHDDSAVGNYFAEIDRDAIALVTINETDPSFTVLEEIAISHV